MEILYGTHPVREAIRAGRRRLAGVHVARGKRGKKQALIVRLAEERGIPLKSTPVSQMNAMAKTHEHQGVCAVVSSFPLTPLTWMINSPGRTNGDLLLLLLDNLVDPHNLGALVRTAVCVGVHGIIITKDRSASPTPAVSKASAGALEHAALARVTNLTATIKTLKKKGIWVAGMHHSASASVYATDLTGPLAIIIGGEGRGIRPLVRAHCDLLVHIPLRGAVDSLNASVAGAVALYEVLRQRLPAASQ